MSFDYRRNFSGLATTSEKHGKNTSVYSQDVFGKIYLKILFLYGLRTVRKIRMLFLPIQIQV